MPRVRVWYEGEFGSNEQDLEIDGVPGTPEFETACQEEAREFRDERVPYGFTVLEDAE